MSSSVILALKKVTPEIENREFLENYIISRLEYLFDDLGIDESNARLFSIPEQDAKYWNDHYGIDVKDLIEDYTIVKGDVLFYDSSSWEKPAPEEEELLEDSFYRFFHYKYRVSDKSIKLVGDELILISSHIIAP